MEVNQSRSFNFMKDHVLLKNAEKYDVEHGVKLLSQNQRGVLIGALKAAKEGKSIKNQNEVILAFDQVVANQAISKGQRHFDPTSSKEALKFAVLDTLTPKAFMYKAIGKAKSVFKSVGNIFGRQTSRELSHQISNISKELQKS